MLILPAVTTVPELHLSLLTEPFFVLVMFSKTHLDVTRLSWSTVVKRWKLERAMVAWRRLELIRLKLWKQMQLNVQNLSAFFKNSLALSHRNGRG